MDNWNKIGNELRDAVTDSLQTGDFSQLGDVLSGTVNSAVAEAKRQINQVREAYSAGQANQYRTGGNDSRGGAGSQGGAGGSGGVGSQGGAGAGNNNKAWQGAYAQKTHTGKRGGASVHSSSGTGAVPVPKARIKMNEVGNVSSVLYMAFGGIGVGITTIALLALLFLAGGLSSASGITGVLLLVFALMIHGGCRQRDRLSRARRYVKLCGNNRYINIEDLALHTGKSERYVLKDVKKMLKLGIFPEGHLDQDKACLMLDDATYREYLLIMKERKAREMEEKVARMQARQAGQGAGVSVEEADEQEQKASSPWKDVAQDIKARTRDKKEAEPMSPELAAMVQEGQEYIRRLRDMNDNIEGEVISAKLFRLENLLKEIFDRVKEHPEQMPQMQKFMNYYLPTTLKLVEAYEDFDSVSAPGEDILEAKSEIEKTLDTINQAFAELLNRLFRDSAFDATTDAQVLQTMLAKEGLTRNRDFETVPR